MIPASKLVLQRRSFRLERTESLPVSGNWYEGKPWTTRLLNAYTLLIPNGERFIIRSCRHYLNWIAPDLKEELEDLFFQEGSHLCTTGNRFARPAC